jgi:hypothetical protein
MAKRSPKKPPPKRRKPADDISRTPKYQAMLEDIVALIEAAKTQGAFGPRVVRRDRRKKDKGQEGKP